MSTSNPSLQDRILLKINTAFSPGHVSIVDETWKHAGHAGAVGGKKHFIVHLVSQRFEGVSRLDRNRMVFDLLKEEMASEIHSLILRTQSPEEWTSEAKKEDLL